MSYCALCENEITHLNDSKEHIVPQAIGGRRKIRRFICKKCNSGGGQDWDAKLAEQYNWFSVALNIKRENGSYPPSQLVRTTGGQGLIFHADGTMSPDKPEIITADTPAGRRISIKARTKGEARKILLGIQRKYPNNNLLHVLETAAVESTLPDGPIMTSFEFGGPFAGRSIVKTAMAMACSMSLPYTACDYALCYLTGEGSTPAFAEFLIRDLVLNRPTATVFHVVSVFGDPTNQRLIAYIEYFGVSRFVVHLSNSYQGSAIQQTYSINPVTGEELDIAVDLALSDKEYELTLINDAVPQGSREAVFNYVMPIVLRSMYKREDERVFKQAFMDTCLELGLSQDQELSEEQYQRFSFQFAQKWALHILHIQKNRPRL